MKEREENSNDETFDFAALMLIIEETSQDIDAAEVIWLYMASPPCKMILSFSHSHVYI